MKFWLLVDELLKDRQSVVISKYKKEISYIFFADLGLSLYFGRSLGFNDLEMNIITEYELRGI